MDIIFIVDNSGSMGDEIEGIRKNISDNFADIIQAANIDYRVIMVTRFGKNWESCVPVVGWPCVTTQFGVCIEPPLSSKKCSPLPSKANNNSPRFYHFNLGKKSGDGIFVQSNDSLCVALDSIKGSPISDFSGQISGGWGSLLLPEALKVFVEISDDNVSCGPYKETWDPDLKTLTKKQQADAAKVVADKWEQKLFSLMPGQFGSSTKRNYIFHAITGIAPKDGAPKEAYAPGDNFRNARCGSAAQNSYVYQELAKRTGGLRYPVCNTSSYDVVFKAIAEGVKKESLVACEFEMPKSSGSGTIDPNNVWMKRTAVNKTETTIPHKSGANACSAEGWYYDSNTSPKKLILCPTSCTNLKKDAGNKIDILLGCLPG